MKLKLSQITQKCYQYNKNKIISEKIKKVYLYKRTTSTTKLKLLLKKCFKSTLHKMQLVVSNSTTIKLNVPLKK